MVCYRIVHYSLYTPGTTSQQVPSPPDCVPEECAAVMRACFTRDVAARPSAGALLRDYPWFGVRRARDQLLFIESGEPFTPGFVPGRASELVLHAIAAAANRPACDGSAGVQRLQSRADIMPGAPLMTVSAPWWANATAADEVLCAEDAASELRRAAEVTALAEQDEQTRARPPLVGQRVRLGRLETRAELNGEIGVAERALDGREGWLVVRLSGNGVRCLVSANHLMVASAVL